MTELRNLTGNSSVVSWDLGGAGGEPKANPKNGESGEHYLAAEPGQGGERQRKLSVGKLP